jgi:hydrogenase-4 transcriptional activator
MFYRWYNRYQKSGVEGLKDQSRRPLNSLENIVERALIVSKEGESLSFDNLLPHKETKETIVLPSGNDESLLMDDAMARHIKYVLDLTKGKVHGKGGAAEVLGINASTLRARMRNLGIPFGLGRRSP